MDGTFSAHPEIFAQLYNVHIKANDEFFPQLWCLLSDKQGVTYVRLFQQAAVNANLQLLPATVHVDFEMGVIQAVRSEFLIEPTGCMFHYSQSILQCGLQVSYNTNVPPETRTWIRRLMAWRFFHLCTLIRPSKLSLPTHQMSPVGTR